MHSSYHNSNFHKSKASITLHQSQCIYEDTDFKSKNKQNNSYQLNKSNNSYLSMLKQKSGFMESKSGFVSMIMGESKVKKNLLTIEQNHNDYSKSGYTNKSILKSYRNHPKILTESDLTDQQDECNFFSEEENQYIQNHPSKQSRSQLKLISNRKNASSRNTKMQGHLKKQIITQDQSQNPQEEEFIEVPPFSFIPSQKLQIKNFVCQSVIKRKNWSLVDLLSLIPHKINALKNVKKLSVINCFLTSLEGIQHFECLEQINLRKNQLRQVQELYRIQNKSKISSINVLGNDIQHFHLGRFQNLSQVFPNLTELNDKNYSMLKQREKGDMRKILKKSSKIENQLKKTLKKQIRKTDRAFLRLNPGLALQQTDRQNIKEYRQRENRLTERDEYSQEDGRSYSKNGNSLSRKSNSEVRSPMHSNYCSGTSFQKKNKQIDDENEVYEIQVSNQNSYSLGDSTNNKANVKNQALPLREVSLGNIQNVPITKSVKFQQRSPKRIQNSLPNKENIRSISSDQIPLQTVPIGKNFLQIKTQDLDNQSDINVHQHQPTATFAMQKERQQQCNNENKQFMFKNKKPMESKTNAKRQLRQQEEIFEEFQNDDDDSEMSLSRISRISEIPTKRLSNNRRSGPSNANSKPDNRSRYDINQNISEQSFMTGNQLYPNGQNASYMAYSQLSQFRPNQSMDDECLLKDNKDGLEQEKLVIASAVYMRNLVTKSLFALFLEANKRKNLPKRRIFV